MNTVDDRILLGKYVQESSEESFRTLMLRYADLVFGACKRILGNAELAEDAAQAVFILLAKNSRKLANRDSLAGWLYTCSIQVSKTMARNERTRRAYEQ